MFLDRILEMTIHSPICRLEGFTMSVFRLSTHGLAQKTWYTTKIYFGIIRYTQ